MPLAQVRGVNINYKILGDRGPWVALSPGGRRDISGIELLAGKVADQGYRVVIFDRRNCGASDVVIDGTESEYEIWADDIHELLRQLNALPAVVGGSSSGCRTALLIALRHPDAVRALLLWRVTGGRFAAERLAEEYYGQFIEAAKRGGMAAVCEMEHWKERIEARPQNRDALMKMTPEQFIKVMSHWREYFLKGADLPVIGEASDGLQAVSRVAELEPDVVVMDLRMPGLDGLQATKRITSANPHVQVVVYSAFDSDGTQQAARQAGATAFVVKGGPPNQVQDTVLAAWQAAHNPASSDPGVE